MEKNGLYFIDLSNDKLTKINFNLVNDLSKVYEKVSNDVRFKNLNILDKKPCTNY